MSRYLINLSLFHPLILSKTHFIESEQSKTFTAEDAEKDKGDKVIQTPSHSTRMEVWLLSLLGGALVVDSREVDSRLLTFCHDNGLRARCASHSLW